MQSNMQSGATVSSPSLSLPKIKIQWRLVFMVVSLVGLAFLFHTWSEGAFLTSRNLSNLSRQVSINLTLATGMTLIILTSGIDLSVGSVLSLAGMTAAILQVKWGFAGMGAMGAFASLGGALLVGGLAGLVNGVLISRLQLTPFIASLGMMVICRGLALIISNAEAVAPVGESLSVLSNGYLAAELSGLLIAAIGLGFLFFVLKKKDLGKGVLVIASCALAFYTFYGYHGIPWMVLCVAAIIGGGIYLLQYTRYGRFLYAIGGNREAAVLSGVPVNKVLFITYLLMGVLAGFAGVLDVSRVNGAVPSAGELSELDAIAAVVIGGTSLMGGVGSLQGTVIGSFILGILNNGMSLVGISEHFQKVFKGLVIIIAVYLDRRSQK